MQMFVCHNLQIGVLFRRLAVKMLFKYPLLHHFLISLLSLSQCDSSNPNENLENAPLLNAKVYSSIFVRRREEHKTLLDHFQRSEKYERKYKLLEVGLNQIVTVLRDSRQKLANENYSTSQGFPKTTVTIDAVSLVFENTCLFGDLVLHMPDMSENVLVKNKEWKEIVEWGIQFTSSFADVIDPMSMKMLSLLEQEINVDKRTSEYINPYRESAQLASKPSKQTKPKNKLRRGPQLTSGRSDL